MPQKTSAWYLCASTSLQLASKEKRPHHIVSASSPDSSFLTQPAFRTSLMISVSSLLCLTIALLMIIACETHRAFNISCRLYFEQRRSRPISSWISDSSWSLIRSREFYITSCRSWRHAAIELRMWLCIRIWHCSALHVSGELLEDPSLARANHVHRRSQISEEHAWAIVQSLRPDVTQSVSSRRQAHVQSVALRAHMCRTTRRQRQLVCLYPSPCAEGLICPVTCTAGGSHLCHDAQGSTRPMDSSLCWFASWCWCWVSQPGSFWQSGSQHGPSYCIAASVFRRGTGCGIDGIPSDILRLLPMEFATHVLGDILFNLMFCFLLRLWHSSMSDRDAASLCRNVSKYPLLPWQGVKGTSTDVLFSATVYVDDEGLPISHILTPWFCQRPSLLQLIALTPRVAKTSARISRQAKPSFVMLSLLVLHRWCAVRRSLPTGQAARSPTYKAHEASLS